MWVVSRQPLHGMNIEVQVWSMEIRNKAEKDIVDVMQIKKNGRDKPCLLSLCGKV